METERAGIVKTCITAECKSGFGCLHPILLVRRERRQRRQCLYPSSPQNAPTRHDFYLLDGSYGRRSEIAMVATAATISTLLQCGGGTVWRLGSVSADVFDFVFLFLLGFLIKRSGRAAECNIEGDDDRKRAGRRECRVIPCPATAQHFLNFPTVDSIPLARLARCGFRFACWLARGRCLETTHQFSPLTATHLDHKLPQDVSTPNLDLHAICSLPLHQILGANPVLLSSHSHSVHHSSAILSAHSPDSNLYLGTRDALSAPTRTAATSTRSQHPLHPVVHSSSLSESYHSLPIAIVVEEFERLRA